MGISNSTRILYKTTNLTESWASFNSMHCLIVFPLFFPPKYLTNPKYMISNWPISSKPTLTIPNNFLFHRQQVKYSQTLTYHNPHLAPMVECKWIFPIMWYSMYCHCQHTAILNIPQQVALYCTILFMWWHNDELCLDGLKINHLKTQTMHVCNTKIKQKGHQFMLTFLLQYTTYIAVIFTYFYHIISIQHF